MGVHETERAHAIERSAIRARRKASGIEARLAELIRRHGQERARPARALRVWAAQAISTLEQSAAGYGITLANVDVGSAALQGQGSDLLKAAQPVQGWRGIRAVPVTIQGTWTGLSDLSSWVRYAAYLDMGLRKLTLQKSAFKATFWVYGR